MRPTEKILTLSAICEIQVGYTPRGRLEPNEFEGVPAIQLRDLTYAGEVKLNGIGRYKLEGGLERYEVGAGDVLFRSRGERNTAVAVDGNATSKAIAILPLLILRPLR